MAVKWAVANGNWGDGTTWNDGVVPTANDDVYLNGFVVAMPNLNTYISVRSINNGETPTTGNFGGYLSGGYRSGTSSFLYLSADLNVSAPNNYFWSDGSRHQALYISGNILIDENSQLMPDHLSYVNNVYCTGNVTAMGVLIGNASSSILQIVGNLSAKGLSFKTVINTANIVGNMDVEGNITATNFTITGNINVSGVIRGTYLTINGSITYKSTDNTMGVYYPTLNILNPDTFTWKDVTEPRSNTFIILTDAEMNNRQQYPAVSDVKKDVEYAWGALVGTMESGVQVGCVTKEDVRDGVSLIGMGEVGTLVVPSVDDVREGVIFDNGSVGTLIVQGGGDRLRIADFSYYTNAQSDTYIVDLTEQDKPKFAVAEERVLIEMFPDLDLDNIPDKYFDDLFVKYLKYRLIVEYYRTAGINSTFTPSEPTTEIVNYRNVNCEIWMNIANTYLKAWGEKYPNSVRKDRILL